MNDRRDLAATGDVGAPDRRGPAQDGAAPPVALSDVWVRDARRGNPRYAETCALLAGVAAFREGGERDRCPFCPEAEMSLVNVWGEGWDMGQREDARRAKARQEPRYWWQET